MSEKQPYHVPTMKEIEALPWNGETVVSTFSGCGGSCLGFRLAGYKVLYANEFIPAARETYLANCAPYTIVDDRDIRTVTAESILELTKMKQGDVSVFEGSPPCANFSTAGKRHAKWGKTSKYSDSKQRSDDLFFEYARLVRGIQPKVFVAENVSGLIKGVAKGYFLDILAELKDCGYRVEARLLDAQWLGVPQARQRIIFVGVRNDLGRCFPEFPTPLPYRYSILDAIPWLGTNAAIKVKSLETDALRGAKFSYSLRGVNQPSSTVMAGGYGVGNRSQYEVTTVDADPSEPPLLTHPRKVLVSRQPPPSAGGERPFIIRSLDDPSPTVTASGIGGSAMNGNEYFVVNEESVEDVKQDIRDNLQSRGYIKLNKPADTKHQKPPSERRHVLERPSPIICASGFGTTRIENVEVIVAEEKRRPGPHDIGKNLAPWPNEIQEGHLQFVEQEAQIGDYCIGDEWDKLKEGQTSERYFSLVRPNSNLPSPTITAVAGHGGTAGVTHPIEKRKFSIAELRRLCSFPDDYVLLGTYEKQWERLGRAVPPVMMQAVAEAVRDKVLARIPESFGISEETRQALLAYFEHAQDDALSGLSEDLLAILSLSIQDDEESMTLPQESAS